MQGMFDSYAGHDDLKKQVTAVEEKIVKEKKEVDKLSMGKTTFKSMFKSKLQKDEKIAKFVQVQQSAEEELNDYKKLIDYLFIFHATQSIP